MKIDKTVYVDESVHPYGRMIMCHMWSEDVEALHDMARAIGIRMQWFQDRKSKRPFPHYDVCKSKRELAISKGAVEITSRDLVMKVREWREKNGT